MTSTSFRVLAAALAVDADVYHFHDPELIPVGLLLKARGKRVIYDVHEDVPSQTLGRHWIPRFLRRSVGRVVAVVEAIGASVFDGIVTATPTISARFPDRKTITVRNYPIPQSQADAPMLYAQRDRSLVYVGAISRDRGMLVMLEALPQLQGRLLLGGTFTPPALLTESQQMPGWSQVDYRGQLNRTEVVGLYNQSRLGIVTLAPTPSYVPSLPVKLFEYMLAGLPVVASDFPLWREIVSNAQCGLLVDPLDPTAIAQACQWIFDHPAEAETMGRRGREAVLNNLNWHREAHKLLRLYQHLTHLTPPARSGQSAESLHSLGKGF